MKWPTSTPRVRRGVRVQRRDPARPRSVLIRGCRRREPDARRGRGGPVDPRAQPGSGRARAGIPGPPRNRRAGAVRGCVPSVASGPPRRYYRRADPVRLPGPASRCRERVSVVRGPLFLPDGPRDEQTVAGVRAGRTGGRDARARLPPRDCPAVTARHAGWRPRLRSSRAIPTRGKPNPTSASVAGSGVAAVGGVGPGF
jgi:hypothetical protein